MKTRIKQLREYLGLSQLDFARKIERTPGFIGNLEHGRAKPSDETINAICAVYHVSENWFREGKVPMFTEAVDQASDIFEGAGERVRAVRKRAGLTQASFGDEIGISRIHIYHIEAKKKMPSKELLEKVSKQFRVSYQWLLTGQGEIDDYEEPTDRVTDELIVWLNKHPEVIRELLERMNLHK